MASIFIFQHPVTTFDYNVLLTTVITDYCNFHLACRIGHNQITVLFTMWYNI